MGLCEWIEHYWSFDEASGATRGDSISTSHFAQGAGIGTVAQAAGLVGDAALLATGGVGPQCQFLDAGDLADQQIDQSAFVGGWFYLPSTPTGEIRLMWKAHGGGIGWGILYDPASGQGTSFWLANDSPAVYIAETGATLSNSAWHFVIGWWDAVANTVNVQVDGGTIATAAFGTPPPSTADDHLYVRGEGELTPVRLDSWFMGRGGVLDSTERTWLYNAGAGRSYADILAYCAADLTVSLTETLALIVADPSGLLADPAAPPAGGAGLPPRYVDADGGFTDACDPIAAGATVCTRTRRTLPAGLAAHLAGTALTLAYCLRLERRDGEVFGFTTHDADLTFGGTTYEALNSLSVTDLRQELGGGVGNLDLAGLLRSDRIAAEDLLAGRYDGAELTLSLVNWADLGDGTVTLARGWFGAVTLADGSWQAEYRSLAQRFAQEVVEVTSALCTVRQLGDARCAPGGVFANGAALSHYQFTRTVAAVLDTRRMTFGADSHASGYFKAGRVVFSSGANDGLEREVKSHTRTAGQAVLICQEGFPFEIEVGDTALLEAGCDRRLQVCKGRFHNTPNYQGFPHVPGFDVMKRLKQAGVVT